MPRYSVTGYDPTGKPSTFETPDFPDPQSEQAFFAPMLKDGWKLQGASRLPDQPAATPTTSPPAGASGLGVTAPPSQAPTEFARTPEEVSAARRRLGMVAATTAAGAVAPYIPGVAAAAEAAGPLVSQIPKIGPVLARVAPAGVRSLASGAFDALTGYLTAPLYPEGGTPAQQALVQGGLGTLAHGATEAGSAAYQGLKSLKQHFIPSLPQLTEEQITSLTPGYRAATRKVGPQPFSLQGQVYDNPAFAGTPQEKQLAQMSALGGSRVAAEQGPAQIAYSQRGAGRLLKKQGGPITPDAYNFGTDIHREIENYLGNFNQQQLPKAVENLKDFTNLGKTVTPETIATTLQGSKAYRLVNLAREIPAARPIVSQGILSTAIDKAGGLDSPNFDISTFVTYMKGAMKNPEVFAEVYGPQQAKALTKLVDNMSRLWEGRGLAVMRAKGLTALSDPQAVWQEIASTIGAAQHLAGQAGINTGAGPGVTSLPLAATTAYLTLRGRGAASALSQESVLNWLGDLVAAKANGTLDRGTMSAFLGRFAGDVLPQLAAHAAGTRRPEYPTNQSDFPTSSTPAPQ